MCMTFGCIKTSDQFLSLVSQFGFRHFGLKAFRHCVSCERNSSYSFSWIYLKLCRCFCQGLKMCMTFGCNPQINFCYFIRNSDLIILGIKQLDTGYLVNVTCFAV